MAQLPGMHVSAQVDYALRAAAELAAAPAGPVTRESIAEAQAIPINYLERIMFKLRTAGLVRSRTYFANALDVRFLESWGQVAVTEPGTTKPIPQAYVKVFAKLTDGGVRFHKDGYTDLRGRFDYASLSDDPNAGAALYAVLVLSDQRGAVIREVKPPAR